MPIISGAIWHNKDSEIASIINKFIQNTSCSIECDKTVLEDSNFIIMSGKRKNETPSEKVKIIQNNAILAGRFFNREKISEPFNIDSTHIKSILATQGQWLNQNVWVDMLLLSLIRIPTASSYFGIPKVPKGYFL